VIKKGGILITLIKPQFEVGRENVGRGIVRDEKLRNQAVQNVLDCARDNGFECRGTIQSPITGGDGNVEYLAFFTVL